MIEADCVLFEVRNESDKYKDSTLVNEGLLQHSIQLAEHPAIRC
jgi:hypothetical protein